MLRFSPRNGWSGIVLLAVVIIANLAVMGLAEDARQVGLQPDSVKILGLTGQVSNIRVVFPAAEKIKTLTILERTLEDQIATMGATLIGVRSALGRDGAFSSRKTLTFEDAESILACPAVRAAAPVVRIRTQVVYGNRKWVPTFMYGTTPSFIEVRDWTKLAEGVPFTEQDVRDSRNVCLIGQTLVRELFQGQSPIGKEVYLGNTALRVVGVLGKKGANLMGMDQDDIVLTPWTTTIKYRTPETSTGLSTLYPSSSAMPSTTQQSDTPNGPESGVVDQIVLAARSTDEIQEAIRQVDHIFRERHRIGNDEPADFSISDPRGLVRRLLRPADVDLENMAGWAMNYLIRTPRKELGYEPVFQCYPLKCPPVPAGQDPVVACDTDARMDWEWYYMRDISGSTAGRDVEAAFHKRMRDYVDADGKVWSHPGCYNEGQTTRVWEKKDYVIHIWGATKILKSLSEDYIRTHDAQSRVLAEKVMKALKSLAIWDAQGRCWFACGMGVLKADGTPVPNNWNAQPAPIVESLVTYWLATHDQEGLGFAKAYAEGIINNCQPKGIRFQPDGSVTGGSFPFGPHSHGTMHAVWGVAHLGVVLCEPKYVEFARKVWDWMARRGTGTGWFPAGPDNQNEMCCLSDMMSVAALIGRAGHAEYYDYVERGLRNYVSNLQFIVTPEFEVYYRERNKAAGEAAITKGLADLCKFEGGIVGVSGLNDYENVLLDQSRGFEMGGCCAPEGMRAIYTAWWNTIEMREASPAGPPGVYVNMSLSRLSPWGEVVSFMPNAGRLAVKAAVDQDYYIRPPHWAAREQVRAFVGERSVPVEWSGAHVHLRAKKGDELSLTYPLIEFDHEVQGLWLKAAPTLKITFHWLGNMVVRSNPPGGHTPLFLGHPRVLPAPRP